MQHGEHHDTTAGPDIQASLDVLDCGDAARRAALAQEVAAVLAGADGEPVMPVARRLALDADPDVRRAFAEAVVEIDTLDADLVFAIASDDDEIALPFLCNSPALDPLRMLAVLRAGGESRQAVIATRPDLSQDAIDFISRELAPSVNALLLENAVAEIGPAHYRTLYKRFGADPDMLDLLLQRPDLPPVIRIVQASRAAAGLRRLLAERDWLSSGVAAEMVTEAQETATLDVLANATAFDLPAAIAFLIDREMLTPALIVRAACQGAMHVVAECLAALSGLPRRRVEERMYDGGRFRALLERCGLPQACYWTLQAACDVAADEHEAGLRLSADEFGTRIIKELLTRYEAMPLAEQPRHLEFLGRYAAERTRRLATQLRAELQQAA